MKKRGFQVVTIYGGRDDRRYVLEIWEQPLYLWLAFRIYHWYDFWVYKTPGFRALEKVLRRRHKGDGFLFIPLGAKQDIRCYHLSIKQRTVLAEVEVGRDVRDKIHPRTSR